MLSSAVAGVQIYTRTRRLHSGLSDEMIRTAVEQFMPAVGAGMLITVVLLHFAPTVLWMLPGIWQVIYSLGVFFFVPLSAAPDDCGRCLVSDHRVDLSFAW